MKLLVSLLILLPSLFCSIGLGNQILGLISFTGKDSRLQKTGFPVPLTAGALLPAEAQSRVDPKKVGSFSGKVSGVISGHVLIIQEGDKTHRVNLYGILSPSKGAPQGEKARVFLEQIAFGRVVSVEPVPPVDPRRIYALVHLEGQNLNQEMLRQGLAWINTKACLLDICETWKALQQEAKDSRKGLWSDPTGAPPWEKKEGKRTKKPR